MGSKRAVGRGYCGLFLVRSTLNETQSAQPAPGLLPNRQGPEGPLLGQPIDLPPAPGSCADLTCLGLPWSLPLARSLPFV